MDTNTTEKQETMELIHKNILAIFEWIGDGNESYQYEGVDQIMTIIQSAVQKAREEMAQEINKKLNTEININEYGVNFAGGYNSGIKHSIGYIKAKYLSPTTEKCHCLEALSGGKHHEHCTEKSKER